MKKVFEILILVTLLFTCTACGQRQDETTSKTANDQILETIVIEESKTVVEEEKTVEAKEDEYRKSFDIYKKNIRVFYSQHRGKEARIGMYFLYNSTPNYITFYCDQNDEFSCELNEIINQYNNSTVFEMMEYFSTTFDADNIDGFSISDQQESNCNDMITLRFSGSAGENDEHSIYGYAFIWGGMECMLLGVTADGSQNESDVKEMHQEIDDMMERITTVK